MKKIRISRGQVTLVDDDVYEWAALHRWTAQKRVNTYHAARYVGRRYIYLHRQITGAGPGVEVDHRDGDGLNNLRTNLRGGSHADNQRAFITLRKNKTSKFRGVFRHSKTSRWQAGIFVDGRAIYLGLFVEEEEAARVRDAAARKFFGPRAQLNFP